MPGMNGIELQCRLRTLDCGTPVIFVTAFPDERSRARAFEAGAIGFLEKPFEGRVIIELIDMAAKPGEIMGCLAYAHPFLDGNGRAIMVVHAILAQRAGISIDWAATGKAEYLSALTKELDDPGKGHLDAYLKPFIRAAITDDRLAEEIVRATRLATSRRCSKSRATRARAVRSRLPSVP
jgi:Response regulator receiver domain